MFKIIPTSDFVNHLVPKTPQPRNFVRSSNFLCYPQSPHGDRAPRIAVCFRQYILQKRLLGPECGTLSRCAQNAAEIAPMNEIPFYFK
jgi:hypothetical protein